LAENLLQEDKQMNKMLEHREKAPLQSTRLSSPSEKASFIAAIGALDRHPEASIKGDISFCVTRQQVIAGPITGHYRVETKDLQEPIFFYWHAQDGEVLNRNASSTEIAFDLRGERTGPWWTPATLGGGSKGQLWTSVISVQVTGADALYSIISATFVQILVIGEDVFEEAG
jgi:hypothetical protein